MEKNNVKAIVEAGAMSSITVIAGLISAFIPFFFPLIPVPTTLLGIRRGLKWSAMSMIVAGVIISMLTDPIRGAKVVTFCLIGLALGGAFKKDYTPGKVLLCGSLAAIIGLGAYTMLTALLLGINPFAIDAEALEKSLLLVMSFYRDHGMDEQQLTTLHTIGLEMIHFMKLLLPTFFIASAVLITAVNYGAARLVLKRLGHQINGFPPFKFWNLPKFVLYVFIGGTISAYFGQNNSIGWLYLIGGNLQYAGLIFAFVQGLAVFYYLADKYNLSRITRGFILLMIFTNSIFSFAVAYAGAFDIALDYRKLRTPHSS